jgi:predicted nuclease of predicted toxin-antitoxin system
MRFLLDENVRSRLAPHLRRAGHDVTTVVDDYPAQSLDLDLLAQAVAEQRILITRDSDFERLVFVEHRPHAGVIYLQLHNPSLATIIARVDAVLASHGHELDRFLVVTADQITPRL